MRTIILRAFPVFPSPFMMSDFTLITHAFGDDDDDDDPVDLDDIDDADSFEDEEEDDDSNGLSRLGESDDDM